MLALQLLLDKLNSGKIDISPEMIKSAREGKVTTLGSTEVQAGGVQVLYKVSCDILDILVWPEIMLTQKLV